MKDAKKFGILLRAFRVAQGLNQTQFAKKAGTANAIICRLERGLQNPNEETLNKICKAFGIKIEVSYTITQEINLPSFERGNLTLLENK